jgi:hypothetical protein
MDAHSRKCSRSIELLGAAILQEMGTSYILYWSCLLKQCSPAISGHCGEDGDAENAGLRVKGP